MRNIKKVYIKNKKGEKGKFVAPDFTYKSGKNNFKYLGDKKRLTRYLTKIRFNYK